MKKSVILAIIVLYVASFFVVGFFGERSRAYDQRVKVEQIECVMAEDKDNIDTSKTDNAVYKSLKDNENIAFVFERMFTVDDVENGIQVTLEFKVLPRTATNTTISYTVSKSASGDAPQSASDSGNGNGSSASGENGNGQSASQSADTSNGSSAVKNGKYTWRDHGDGIAVFMFYEPTVVDVLIKAADGVQLKVRIDVYGSRDYYIEYG
ncbi:MAG: hypothetical protein ILP02_00745 [Clostridia bacterium]|nr:hypothetical protein [Clostridia bacterium]